MSKRMFKGKQKDFSKTLDVDHIGVPRVRLVGEEECRSVTVKNRKRKFDESLQKTEDMLKAFVEGRPKTSDARKLVNQAQKSAAELFKYVNKTRELCHILLPNDRFEIYVSDELVERMTDLVNDLDIDIVKSKVTKLIEYMKKIDKQIDKVVHTRARTKKRDTEIIR